MNIKIFAFAFISTVFFLGCSAEGNYEGKICTGFGRNPDTGELLLPYCQLIDGVDMTEEMCLNSPDYIVAGQIVYSEDDCYLMPTPK